MSGSETTKRMIARINAEQREWDNRESVNADVDDFDKQLHAEDDYSYMFEDVQLQESHNVTIGDDDKEQIDSRLYREQIDDNDLMPTKSGTGRVAASEAGSKDVNDDADDLSVFDEPMGESLDDDFDDVVMMGQRISSCVDVLGESNVVQHDGQSLSRHVRILLDGATGVEYLMFTDERGITVTPRYNADGTLRTGRIIDSGF